MVYLDSNATTRIEAEVLQVMHHYLTKEFGNPGSRSHEFGISANRAIAEAREHVSEVVGASEDEVVFTSGATESNNIAILGLESFGRGVGRNHIVTSAIEHKAVLEPVEALRTRGFAITYVAPLESGAIPVDEVLKAITPETLLLSVMHVNNETGVVQSLTDIADSLCESQQPEVFFHTDAAQGYGKELEELKNPRIDMISISGHKIYGPMGIGALITRTREYDRVPLKPIMYGGGQQGGIRPGTLPTPLIAGLGEAARIALRDHSKRESKCTDIRKGAVEHLAALDPVIIGSSATVLPHVLNIAFPGIDGEAILLHLRNLVCASTGSACTSSSMEPSHVLTAMGLSNEIVQGAIRLSWSHLSEDCPWGDIATRISQLRN